MSIKWEFSAGGIVFKEEDNKIYVLLVRTKDRWSFPKGNIEKTESKENAAVREIKEETGIEGEIIDYLGNVEYYYRKGIDTIHKFVYYYLLRYKGGEITPQKEEIDEAVFVPIEEAEKLLSFDKDKQFLKKAENIIKTLIVK